MGLYSDSILPRLLDLGMRGEPFRPLRARVLAPVRGRVLELGFGSGLNLPHYTGEVSELIALEPSALARRLAARRVERRGLDVRFTGLRGEEIPLDAGSVDAVVSTWTMCTIEDLERALAEVRRVLRPGGELHFLEHGLAPEARVARWQRRLNGLQMRAFGGCRLDRDIAGDLRRAGFELPSLETFYTRGPRTHAFHSLGIARPS